MEIDLNRESSTPLYEQIAHNLKNMILKKELKADDKLPTEKDLMERYKVSRLTIRKAISILNEEGLITIRQGKGMFVRNRTIKMELDDVNTKGFNEILSSQEINYERKFIKYDEVVAPTQITEELNQSQRKKLPSVQQLFLVENQPIGLLVTYLSPEIGFTEKIGKKMETQSFLSILQNDLNITPRETKYSLEARAATAELADMLNVALGYPLLVVQRTTLMDNNKPFESTLMYLISDFYQFKFNYKNGDSTNSQYVMPLELT